MAERQWYAFERKSNLVLAFLYKRNRDGWVAEQPHARLPLTRGEARSIVGRPAWRTRPWKWNDAKKGYQPKGRFRPVWYHDLRKGPPLVRMDKGRWFEWRATIHVRPHWSPNPLLHHPLGRAWTPITHRAVGDDGAKKGALELACEAVERWVIVGARGPGAKQLSGVFAPEWQIVVEYSHGGSSGFVIWSTPSRQGKDFRDSDVYFQAQSWLDMVTDPNYENPEYDDLPAIEAVTAICAETL